MKTSTKTILGGLLAAGGAAAAAYTAKAVMEAKRTPCKLYVTVYDEKAAVHRRLFDVDEQLHIVRIDETGASPEKNLTIKLTPHKSIQLGRVVFVESQYKNETPRTCLVRQNQPCTIRADDAFVVFHLPHEYEAGSFFDGVEIPSLKDDIWEQTFKKAKEKFDGVLKDTPSCEQIKEAFRNIGKRIEKRHRPF